MKAIILGKLVQLGSCPEGSELVIETDCGKTRIRMSDDKCQKFGPLLYGIVSITIESQK